MRTRHLFTLASLVLLLTAATGCTDDHSDPNEPLRTGQPVDFASIRIASSSANGGSGAAGIPATDAGGFYPGDVIRARLLHGGTTQVAELTNIGTSAAPQWDADPALYWQSATTGHTLTLSRGSEGEFTLPDDMEATTPVQAPDGSGGTTPIPNYTLHDRLFASHADLLPGNAPSWELEHRMAQIVVTLTRDPGSALPTDEDLSKARVSMTLPAHGHFDGATGVVSRRGTGAGGAADKKQVKFLKGTEQAGTHPHFAVALPGGTGTQVITITIPAGSSTAGKEHTYQYTAPEPISLEAGRSRVFRLSLGASVSALSISTTEWKDAAQGPGVSEGLRIIGVTPGELAGLLPTTTVDYKHVRVSGALDATDYRALTAFLNGLPSPVSLEIEIKGGDKDIPGFAFEGCQKLGAVALKGMEQIGEQAFYESSLTSITLPEGLTHIGESAFSGCTGLKSITLPSSVKSLDTRAFSRCTNLASVSLPEELGTIGDGAFMSCTSLKSISLPASVTTWGEGIFYGSGLTSIALPEGMEEIPGSTFANCYSLQTITLPSTITTVGDYAFFGSGLTSIILSEGLTTIGGSAFENCTELQKVAIHHAEGISVSMNVFAGIHADKKLFIYGAPTTIDDTYQLNTPWQTIYYNYQSPGDKLDPNSYSNHIIH